MQIVKTIQDHINRQTTGLAGRVVQSLNHDWRFHLGEVTGAEFVGFDDAEWVAVNVPHDYSITGEFSEKHPSSQSGGWVPTGVGWYRKRIHVPTIASGQKIFVLFDGVSMNSQVWINGRFLGLRPSGHMPFHYDITAFLNYGEGIENILAVRVDTSLQPYSRFYCGSGINRHVKLMITNPLHIEHMGVTINVTQIDSTEAHIEICTDVRVERYADTDWDLFRDPTKNNIISKNCILTTRILDQQGNVCVEANEACEMPQFSKQRLQQCLILPSPRLWSPDDPYLYMVQSQLSVDGQVIDETRTTLGVRTITVDTVNGLQINSRQIKLKGVCLHQDAGVFGSAMPLKKWVRQLRMMQGMGCNAVRTSHHPFPAEFYDCCDLLGLLVVDEAFDEWQMGWTRGQAEQPFGKNTYGYHLYFEQWHDTDMRAMIRRDRNHPSVIMWSIGNEIPEQYYAEGAVVARRLVAICKEEDPTRPVTLGTEGNGKLPILDDVMETLDIKGYNYVDLKNGTAFYDTIHREHPDWVLLGTETGYDPAHWQAVIRDPAVIGQFLWVGYDYLGESAFLTPDSPPDKLNHGWRGGIVTITDEPKPEYHYRRCMWSDEPVARLAIKTLPWTPTALWEPIPAVEHWNWTPGEMKTIYGFSNCEETELFLNDQSLGVKIPGDAAHPCLVEWEAPFEPGTLRLVARRGGVNVCEDSITTAGEPACVELQTDDSTLNFDGSDMAIVDIRVVDVKGIVVPDFAKQVTVHVTGAGILAGMTNGDLDCRDSFCASETTLVAGRAQAVVRAAFTGEIVVTVQVAGLATAHLTIPAVGFANTEHPTENACGL